MCSLSITHSLLVFVFILLNSRASPLLLCLSGTQVSAGQRIFPGGCSRASRWSLGQCLPPSSCLSALPVTILVAVSYGGSSGNSPCQGSECLMVSGLIAESDPGCAYEGLGSGQDVAHHLWGAQRPLWSLLDRGRVPEASQHPPNRGPAGQGVQPGPEEDPGAESS